MSLSSLGCGAFWGATMEGPGKLLASSPSGLPVPPLTPVGIGLGGSSRISVIASWEQRSFHPLSNLWRQKFIITIKSIYEENNTTRNMLNSTWFVAFLNIMSAELKWLVECWCARSPRSESLFKYLSHKEQTVTEQAIYDERTNPVLLNEWKKIINNLWTVLYLNSGSVPQHSPALWPLR